MFRKKIIILAIFLVSLVMLSAVSAADDATSDIVSETPDEDLDVSEDEVLESSPDTFTNLMLQLMGMIIP